MIPILSILTITYGHEAYIAETIEGVLNQEVDFPVEMIIADDCSPDNTEKVVRGYIENHPNGHWIKYTKHKENKGMNKNFIWALEQCQGKYIALCEGDDYWTDPLKLQKQVDFLEEHSDYNLCYHNASILKGASIVGKIYENTPPEDSNIIDYFKGNYTKTCCCVFRWNDEIKQRIEDLPIMSRDDSVVFPSIIGPKGKYHYLNESMAVYRVHVGGVWSTIDYFDKLKQRCVGLDFRYKHFSKVVEIEFVGEKLKRSLLELLLYYIIKRNFTESKKTWKHYRKLKFGIPFNEHLTLYRKVIRNLKKKQ